MFTQTCYIMWNPSDTIVRIGSFALHWYSMCWLVGLTLAYLIVRHLYSKQHIKSELFEPLFIYCFVGVLVGGRLGHCLFYEPEVYLSSWRSFIEMLLPIEFDAAGDWHFTGYRGLASHGGVIGMLIALWLYARRTQLSMWTVLDNIGIAAPVTAFFIRMGNLMNSEIIGKPTDVPWAFVFEQVDMLPRHPGQLYEALAYLLLLGLGWALWRRHPERVGTGFFFGLCLTYVFTARILIEFTKDIQVAFEASMPLNMGQLLSLPFLAIGVACMLRSRRKQPGNTDK